MSKNDARNEKIVCLLKENKEISAYSFVSSEITSKEMFFVKDKLDMNRAKDVVHTSVTVYKDFEADGKKMRGSALFKVFPQDSDDVIRTKIEEAAFAARFVKNEWYPLPLPSGEQEKNVCTIPSPIESLMKMHKVIYSIYSQDARGRTLPAADINSAEFFATISNVRVVNSEGVDVSFVLQKNEVELITDAKGDEGDEDVEIYGYEVHGEVDTPALNLALMQQLSHTAGRAVAKKAVRILSINVILTGEAVPKFFQFYKNQASSQFVYSGQSRAKIGEAFQKNCKGDKVSITLDPSMKGSPYSAAYDTSGIKLEKVKIFEDGVVKTYHGDARYAHYLNIKPTGVIENMEVAPGSISNSKELCNSPFVEISMFSDFFMDQTTGNFGGEFRLAQWFDGKDFHHITAGSIQGNMFQVQDNMFFSKEIMQKGEYKGPQIVLIPNMEIVG